MKWFEMWMLSERDSKEKEVDLPTETKNIFKNWDN